MQFLLSQDQQLEHDFDAIIAVSPQNKTKLYNIKNHIY